MSMSRISRPASVVLAAGASAVLLAGLLVPGVVLGVFAVAAAWLRWPPPPSQPGD